MTWLQADLFELPFAEAEFDHLFICFVLEHLPDPHRALTTLRRLLRPGGTLTVIEGDHGSAFFHPDSPHARATVDCLVRLQSAAGGNGLLGRQLHPLLSAAGFTHVTVHPRTVYVDRSRPALVKGFTLDTFTAMIESVRDDALAANLMTPADWERGIADLRRTATDDNGTFHYTFFKAVAQKSAAPGPAAAPTAVTPVVVPSPTSSAHAGSTAATSAARRTHGTPPSSPR